MDVQLSIESQVLSLPLRDPFRIARDEDPRSATTVIVSVTTGGLDGVGEAFPVAYYGETVGTIGVVLPSLAGVVGALDAPPASLAARACLAHRGRPADGGRHRPSRRRQGGPRYRAP